MTIASRKTGFPTDHFNISNAASDYLEDCCKKYAYLIDQLAGLRQRNSAEALLTWIELTAGFSATNHAGRFADGAIENLALEVGYDLPKASLAPPISLDLGHEPGIIKKPRRRIVHIVTVAMAVGGLTRMVLNWVRKDSSSQHSLILTRQGSNPIPPALLQTIAASGGKIYSFPEMAPILLRAAWLRSLATQLGEIGFLHVISDDVVPVVAFADSSDMPIGLINLADHVCWLGSTIADAIVNLRDISIEANRRLRFTRNELLLPIPLHEQRGLPKRQQARAELNIPPAQHVILTVGRPMKYAETSDLNFFRAAKKILEENPESHLYIVGLREQDQFRSPSAYCHERMHFVGEVSDPTKYQISADLYLEGFPFGSQTALLEGALQGVPCVRAAVPLSPLLAASDISINDLLPVPADETEYARQAFQYISNRSLGSEIGHQLRERILHHHVREGWYSALEDVYVSLASCKHSARPIPATECSTRAIDLAISEFHRTRTAISDHQPTMNGFIRQSKFAAAYNLRERGYHLDAFRIISSPNFRFFWNLFFIKFAVKLLPHYIVHSLSAKREDRLE